MPNTNLDPSYVNKYETTHSMKNTRFSVLMRAVIEKGKAFRFQAAGFSMEPFIKNEDIITIMPVSPDKIRLGDVLAFAHPIYENLIVHRVVLCREKKFLMKADNKLSPDGWVGGSNVIGLVNAIERDGKKIKLGLGIEKYLISTISRFNLIRTISHIKSKITTICKIKVII